MQDAPQTTIQEDKFTDALRVLLRAIVDVDLNRKDDGQPIKVHCVSDWAGQPVLSRKQIAVSAILREPVRGALKMGVRALGQEIFDLTADTEIMLRISDAACDGPNGGRCLSIVNSAWDGIGDWYA
jgi:hypothetical protein